MVAFDNHNKCTRCRDKGVGKDSYVIGGVRCQIFESFSTNQKEILKKKDKKKESKRSKERVSPTSSFLITQVKLAEKKVMDTQSTAGAFSVSFSAGTAKSFQGSYWSLTNSY